MESERRNASRAAWISRSRSVPALLSYDQSQLRPANTDRIKHVDSFSLFRRFKPRQYPLRNPSLSISLSDKSRNVKITQIASHRRSGLLPSLNHEAGLFTSRIISRKTFLDCRTKSFPRDSAATDLYAFSRTSHRFYPVSTGNLLRKLLDNRLAKMSSENFASLLCGLGSKAECIQPGRRPDTAR